MDKKSVSINSRSVFSSFIKIIFLVAVYVFASGFFEKHLNTKILSNKFSPHNILLVLIILLITIQVTLLLRNLIWDYYFPKKRKIQISSLLIGIINSAIYLACVFIICSYVLGYDIQSAFAATGAIGVVIGFGLQRMFMDLFIGISMDMDKSFQIGNWVHIRYNGMDIIGCIVQMNWRIISLQSSENKLHQIPNNIFGNSIVTNLSLPSVDAEFEILYTIPYMYNEKKVMDTIMFGLDAAAATGKIFDYKCRIDIANSSGVIYKVKYWIRPDQISPGKARHLIHSNVFRFLRSERISFATNNYDVHLDSSFDNVLSMRAPDEKAISEINNRKSSEQEIISLLQKVDLFQTLDHEQIEEIAKQSIRKVLNKGSVICEQGESGQSLFVVAEGFLRVFIALPNGEKKQVAVLIPEDFFGEMSMLTGAPRSATVVADSKLVVYEITAEALLPIFKSNDKFHTILARTITDREIMNAKLSNLPQEPDTVISRFKELEEKILRFTKKLFGIKS